MIIKNVKLMELIQKLWVLSWIHSITDDLIKYKYLCCNKNYQKSFMKTKNKSIVNTYKFSNHDINKIILLLWKGVYPYEYIDDWKKILWNVITWKKHCHLEMEDITDTDYMHTKRVWNKNVGGTSWFVWSKWYIHLRWCVWELPKYVSENILTWPCLFSYCTRISIASSLKKTKVKLDLLLDTTVLLMVEKGVTSGVCHAVHHLLKLITNTGKVLVEIKNHPILSIGM